MQFRELVQALKGYKDEYPDIVGNLWQISRAEAEKRWELLQEAIANKASVAPDEAVIAAKAVSRAIAPIVTKVRAHAHRLAYAVLVAAIWTAIRVPGWSLQAMRATYQAGLFVGKLYRVSRLAYENRELAVQSVQAATAVATQEVKLQAQTVKAEVTYRVQKTVIFPTKGAIADLGVKTRALREEAAVIAFAVCVLATPYRFERPSMKQLWGRAYRAAVAGGGWLEAQVDSVALLVA